MTRLRTIGATGAAIAAIGCSSSPSGPMTDAQYAQTITQGMHDSLQANLNALVQGTTALQAAAPIDYPWDDADPAYPAMQAAWIQARHAYEQIEGATAPIFPNIDTSIDGRVEDFGPSPGLGVLTPSCDMFSGLDASTNKVCFTGLHAIERIMYVTTTPPSVTAYEQGLGYVPAQAFPTTQQEADNFKTVLCAQAVTDATTLLNEWQPAVIDIGNAFQGLISLMNEQREKVTKAGLDQEESRYSQRTMDNLRQNLTGTTNIYALFQPWIRSKSGGPAVDTQVENGFAGLNTLYNSTPYLGVALPAPPPDWSDTDPSQADLQTTFGQLFSAVQAAVDPSIVGSVVFEMNAEATMCDLPVFDGG